MFSKSVVWAIFMRQFENFDENGNFRKDRNLKWEYLPKKGGRVIVTSFS